RMRTAIDRAAVLLEDARPGVPLGPMTTYRVGGPAALFMEVTDDHQLVLVAKAVQQTAVPVLVVGRGSNLLVADAGFPGLAITLGGSFAEIDVRGTAVRSGGAVSLPVLARRTAAAGLTGLEWAVGVPGSVGGAVRMNAGGHGSDVSRSITLCRVVDLQSGEDTEAGSDRLALGYRS